MKVKIKHVASQSLKILLCLVILFAFMFVQPKENLQKADAALPAVLVAVLGSIVLDVALDMGIDFVDKKAGQDWSKKLVGNLWNKYGKKISDLKPTKTNAGKWTIKLGKDLLALIVDEIGDNATDVVKKDTERKKKNNDDDGDGYVVSYDSGVDTDDSDPFYQTSVYIKDIVIEPSAENDTPSKKVVAFLNEWVTYEISPNAYDKTSNLTMLYGSRVLGELKLKGGAYVVNAVMWQVPTPNLMRINFKGPEPLTGVEGRVDLPETDGAFIAFLKYLERLEANATKTYFADGVLVTDGYDSYVDLPDDVVLTDEQLKKIDYSKMPTVLQNDRDFEFEIDDSTVIDADYEVINEGDQFEWEIIEQDVINQGDNIYKDFELDYSPVTNNNYTLTKDRQDDINNDIIINIDNDVDSSLGKVDVDVDVEGFMYCVDKATSGVVPCKEIEAIDGGLLAYIGNAYDYAVNAVKSAVNGLNTIVAGSAGLITLYSNIFDWLPSEMTVILTSGLLLMIGLRVFRK